MQYEEIHVTDPFQADRIPGRPLVIILMAGIIKRKIFEEKLKTVNKRHQKMNNYTINLKR